MFRTLMRGLSAAIAAATFVMPVWANNIPVTDTLGREVMIPHAPERILLGFYFEDFYAVGGPDAYDRVVAISKDTWFGWRNLQWKAYAAVTPRLETLADVGEIDSGTFSLEAAIAANPDVAVLAAWQYNALGADADRLEAARIPIVVLDYNAQTVEKHVVSTLALGVILGAKDRAQQLADEYASAIANIDARIANVPQNERPKVYVELGRKGAAEVDNSYAGTMWGAVVNQVGGQNIADGQISKWGPLNPEYVLAQNPQAIFLAGSGWVGRDAAVLMGPGIDTKLTHERMKPYLGRSGWNDLDAVKNGNVYAIYHGGSRTLYDYTFQQFIAKALYPDLFKDVDPQANLDRFFKTYLPVPFTGTYMTRLK